MLPEQLPSFCRPRGQERASEMLGPERRSCLEIVEEKSKAASWALGRRIGGAMQESPCNLRI